MIKNKQERKIFVHVILTWYDNRTGLIPRHQKKVYRISHCFSRDFTIEEFNEWYKEQKIEFINYQGKYNKNFYNTNFHVEIFFEPETYGLKNERKYEWFLKPEKCKNFEEFKNYGEIIQSFYNSLLILYNKEQCE